MASVYINSEQINVIASKLKSKGDNILNQYKNDCTSALNMSRECLQLSGLDTTEFFKSLETIYSKLNSRIADFSDFLTNTVAVEYDFTSQAITASFNGEFANDISRLLGVSVHMSLEKVSNPAIPGRPITPDTLVSSSPAIPGRPIRPDTLVSSSPAIPGRPITPDTLVSSSPAIPGRPITADTLVSSSPAIPGRPITPDTLVSSSPAIPGRPIKSDMMINSNPSSSGSSRAMGGGSFKPNTVNSKF